MAAQRLTLHLDPVRSAENLLTIIDVMARQPSEAFQSFADILARVRKDYDFTDRVEPLSLAVLLGLLIETDGIIELSCTARVIAGLRAATRADLMHLLLTTAWSNAADVRLGCSWAYRVLCERLWSRGSVCLNAAESKQIVADLLGSAREAFPGRERLALSTKSVLGMRKWIDLLDPPVLVGDQFYRREICSSELLLLAMAQVATEDGADIHTDLLMTSARREAICRLCLLEPSALDRALDRAIGVFPAWIEPGTRTGSHGRFVRFKHMPSIPALAHT